MKANQLFSLENKCAVVIGGAGKIGFPMSEALAEAGARVYIASRNPQQNSKIKNLQDNGLQVQGIEIDQSNEENVQSVIEFIKNDFKAPDILINSGVERPMGKFFDDQVENWDRSMEVNARGLFVTCRAFSNEMVKSNAGGSIINIASIYGLVAPDLALYEGTDFQTEPDYPYTKGGMIMFSKYLASFLAKKNVRVNCVAPGGFFNNQGEPFYSQYIKKVPMARMATHEDLKGVAIFLASDASKYITGTVIPVDGGFTTI